MDRGFTFKLISNYINNVTASDNKVPELFNFLTAVTLDFALH